ncbi:MAG: Pseudouridine kinase [Bacilli bacterium]|nr:Pseudouridine kinase [Bacilli bacterium]
MNISTAVIGTIFIDCKGFAQHNYQADSRNLGSIQFVHGGVGRNVAENLAHLQIPTAFISTVDQSGIGDEVVTRLKQAEVNTDHIHKAASNGMGMWLAIMDEHGNLAGSISQMPELSHLGGLLDKQGEMIIQRSSHIALELDLNEQISRQVLLLAHKHGKPVYGIPGNLDVILNHPDLLDSLECFICNHYEAEKLLLHDINELAPEAIIPLLIKYVDALKLRAMVITLGANGSVFYDSKTQESGFQPVYPVKLIDSSGAGDAFFSGTVMGLIRGVSIAEAVQYGTKVAGWTIESAENTCSDLYNKMKKETLASNELKSLVKFT